LFPLTLKEIAGITGGTLRAPGSSSENIITDITTDSRTAKSGCLFAAIKGEQTDGHRYMEKAFEAGASAMLCEQLPERKDIPSVLVPSTLAALQKIAAHIRKVSGIPVVGIAGSVGKTSTKEMTAAVLARKFRLLKTEGNFNNDLGVPLTLFRLEKEHELAVIEMGISDFGEMHVLADIARPDVCIMTNIGDCHLEFLHDRDGVWKAKSEMFDFLDEKGVIILNGDDAHLGRASDIHGIKPVFYGLSDRFDVYADDIEPVAGRGSWCTVHTKKESERVFVPSPGEHMVYNALAGAAAGLSFGMTLPQICEGIASYETISGRFNIIDTGYLTIIDDCYNANPMSMKASLSALSEYEGRKVAVVGDMAELGPTAEELHRQVGEHAALLPLSLLVCIGPLSQNIALGAKEGAFTVLHFPDKENFIAEMPGLLQKGDTVLVKASHSMEFPAIVEKLVSTQLA